MRLKKIFMLLFLQTILFCVIVSCTKQPNSITISNNDTTMNVDSTGNTDTTSNIDTTGAIDTAANTGNFTWLALGDSYTIGQSVSEAERFPAQTISLLKNDSLFIKSPQYIATTGWTTLNLLAGITSQNPQGPFDIVSLLIGVNDQYQHFDTGGYRIHFEQCLQQAIALSGNNKEHVFVLSIPDYSVTPFAQYSDTAQIKKELDEFNAINKEITLAYNISYTDITPFTREAKNDGSLIAGDGLHPSGKEYAKWSALLAPEIKKVLH
jgi:lysophospholipase L1-like esterase